MREKNKIQNQDEIHIKGARVHNLKNVSLDLPKEKIVVFTGVSGSGKSSLAFDTIFAEGQRRYIESLSPYARQFLGQMDRPDVDEITGLSPAISIGQKALSHNPRSTVGTLTEIYDYLRVLFARLGEAYCPICGHKIQKMDAEQIFNLIKEDYSISEKNKLTVSAPLVRGRKGEYYQLIYDFIKKGFHKAKVDGEVISLHDKIILSRNKQHNISIIIDQIKENDKSRIFEAIESALNIGGGLVEIDGQEKNGGEKEKIYSTRWSCPYDGFSFPEIEPRLFSFNSPYGACPTCHGLGKEDLFSDKPCSDCHGKRLKKEVLSIKINGLNIDQVVSLPIPETYKFFVDLIGKLSDRKRQIANPLVHEIVDRLDFLLEVGLDYLDLKREAHTLSGGEAQRIRLSSQIGSKLSNTLYVLDEPTIGLHERDTNRLIATLKKLKDLKNTLVVVEHDEQVIRDSDFFVELGPAAGSKGGEIIHAGYTDELLKNKKNKSLTLDYLRGDKKIKLPHRRTANKGALTIVGAKANNLKNLKLSLPLNKFICVTGVSGSGKSTLLEDVVYPNLVKKINHINLPLYGLSRLEGYEKIKKVIKIDQGPIGQTPRSNPATYTGIFSPIRDFYACLEEAQIRGYSPSRFSFNVQGGRCEACQGAGHNLVEMHFLAPILVQCDVCRGKRFNRETLEVKYKNKSIADVLNMTVAEAAEFFEDAYDIREKLSLLSEIGLGYIQLGQSATTLSGGEAQRIKLAKELSNKSRETFYILDEPTVGLHFHDVALLLQVIQRLVEQNNTVVVVEHNLEMIKCADHIVDLGPEGGDRGGKIVAHGTPEEVAKNKFSYTGHYLNKILNA